MSAQSNFAVSRKLSQKDVNYILGEHQRFVAGQPGVCACLRSTNMDGLVLANRDLTGADLVGASLKGANLYGANLTRAKLCGVDLSESDMRNTCLVRADLRGACFKDADLAYAVMDFADLGESVASQSLRQGKAKTGLPDEPASGAVDFSNCSLRYVSFEKAHLDNANFSNALLEGAKFKGATLSNACFRGAILTGVDVADLAIPSEALKDCLTTSAAASEHLEKLMATIASHHEWVVSGGATGSYASIDGEDLRPLSDRLKGLSLVGLSARNVIATYVDFSGCQLQAAKLDGADLRGAKFVETDLSGASLNCAKLAHADFRNAVIQDLLLFGGKKLLPQAKQAQALAEQFKCARVVASSFTSGLTRFLSPELAN